MASSLLASIKPFVLAHPSPSRSRPLCAVPRRCSVRAAVAGKKLEPSKVVPQADRVLIRLEELPQKSAGGVLMPKSAVKFERYLMGEILSVGSDVSQLEAGKKVLFSDVNAYEVDLGSDAKHCFCRSSDLLAIVE
ncbi:10 kDa chaperonin 1, chloroplastic-like [Dioscorea cayenensis subsp. rotundata]|uniref:10 kDa chaperonin 1, chloroplastic-like n=1 Tax=Dioscorea cayennensis subsp. rotundata TaxID=55577 RepID=A0AB40B1P2_DIOCR|nr:10 kDa chaperonin 1, chloroplastic-like [Dioscorea cayenensis subsp. rotundata]